MQTKRRYSDILSFVSDARHARRVLVRTPVDASPQVCTTSMFAVNGGTEVAGSAR